MQLNRSAKLLNVIGLTTKHAVDFHLEFVKNKIDAGVDGAVKLKVHIVVGNDA